jgi:hypothetical protein
VKVKANATYRYNPVLLDQFDSRTSLQKGDLVRVVNLPGCPRANTMGHCHVADPTTGHFIGLVCCNSLEPVAVKYVLMWHSKEMGRYDSRSEAERYRTNLERDYGPDCSNLRIEVRS